MFHETKNFQKEDLIKVKKAMNDKLGLDFDVNRHSNGTFSLTVMGIDDEEEISLIIEIENQFNAKADDEWIRKNKMPRI